LLHALRTAEDDRLDGIDLGMGGTYEHPFATPAQQARLLSELTATRQRSAK
jgi:hypothetical protein